LHLPDDIDSNESVITYLPTPQTRNNSNNNDSTNFDESSFISPKLYHNLLLISQCNFMNDLPRNFYTLSMFVPKNKMEEITFFLQFGFIGTSILYQICNCFMFLYPGQNYRIQFCWKCTKCKITYSILRDSIFSNFQELLFKILIRFYCFAEDMSLDSTVIQTELSKTTVQKFFRLLRNCC
jgi:hypothetical protein